DYLECPHLTTLALQVARGERARPFVADEHAELLRRKGELHERAYLERLRAEGRQIVEITLGEPWDFEAAGRQTAEAMRAGAEIISQATFVDGRWRGRPGFEAAIAGPQVTEPYPVEHCSLCDFRAVCAARWEAEDHLVQVASVRRDQVTRLRDGGLPTLTALAQAAPGMAVADVAAHTFERLRDQAALQHARRTTGALDWHAIEADAGCGFEALPPPSAGDLIFDIEGDPFWEPA